MAITPPAITSITFDSKAYVGTVDYNPSSAGLPVTLNASATVTAVSDGSKDLYYFSQQFGLTQQQLEAMNPNLNYLIGTGNPIPAGTVVIIATGNGSQSLTFGSPGLMGAYLSPSDWPEGTMAGAITDWQNVLGRTMQVRRQYFGPDGSNTAMPATITDLLKADADAGRKAIISLKPAYNPTTQADHDAVSGFLSSCKSYGLVFDVAIWHEPVPQGLSVQQFTDAVNFYADAIKPYGRLSFNQSGYPIAHGTDPAAYYPGDVVDIVTLDGYCPSYDTDSNLLSSVAAVADAHSKPFGLWEFNGCTNTSISGHQTQAQVTSFFQAIQSLFAGRLQAGKANADVLFFNHADGTDNCDLVNTAGDFRVPLLQSIQDAIT